MERRRESMVTGTPDGLSITVYGVTVGSVPPGALAAIRAGPISTRHRRDAGLMPFLPPLGLSFGGAEEKCPQRTALQERLKNQLSLRSKIDVFGMAMVCGLVLLGFDGPYRLGCL